MKARWAKTEPGASRSLSRWRGKGGGEVSSEEGSIRVSRRPKEKLNPWRGKSLKSEVKKVEGGGREKRKASTYENLGGGKGEKGI